MASGTMMLLLALSMSAAPNLPAPAQMKAVQTPLEAHQGLRLEDPMLGILQCSSASRQGLDTVVRCSYLRPTQPGAEILIRTTPHEKTLIIESGKDDLSVSFAHLRGSPQAPLNLYELAMQLNKTAQISYLFGLENAFEDRPMASARMEPREETDAFQEAARSSQMGTTVLLPLLDLLQGAASLQPDAVFIMHSLQAALGPEIPGLEVWICERYCFRTTQDYVCYRCTYGGFCIIGECCGNPYPSPIDETGNCGGGSIP